MHIGIFEDHTSQNFFPLTCLRPVFDLRCGILTLRERIQAFLSPESQSLIARSYLAPLLSEQYPGVSVNAAPPGVKEVTLVNGRCLMDGDLAKRIRKMKGQFLVTPNGDVVAARLSAGDLRDAYSNLAAGTGDPFQSVKGEREEVKAAIVSFPWDLLSANGEYLSRDFHLLTKNGRRVRKSGKTHKAAILIGKKGIHLGKKSDVGPGVVLDASNGPVYVDDRATILPQAVITGPAYIGNGSLIRAGARIYQETSIGPVCKVGGEVEHSVLLSYSNKQHDGFLGHSYLASWVNLGAGTTTSNLKNTYGTVRVAVNGRQVDTGLMFMGLTAGDHVKTGINGTLDTGSVVGVSSNVFGTSLLPKYIPSFSWGNSERMTTYDFEKALKVAATVMGRRNVTMTDAYRAVFLHIFDLTAHERAGYTPA
jgi:UDP-N-acetylglucosamine diphosphorylase/glucosamine-1-phosphate N-acetyltransferase